MDLRSFVVRVTINGVLHFVIPRLNPNFQLQTFISLYRLLHHLTSSMAPVTLTTTTRGHLTIKPLVTSQIVSLQGSLKFMYYFEIMPKIFPHIPQVFIYLFYLLIYLFLLWGCYVLTGIPRKYKPLTKWSDQGKI